jgi:predicted ATPase
MRSRVGVLNDGLLLEHGVFIEARAAVNTGEALVGTTGGDLATGRTVSVAEQLGSAAAPGHIVLGEATRVLVRDAVETEPLPTGPGGASGHRLVELRPDVRGRALRLDSPLVGRRRQLAALATAFETTVAEGSSHLVTLLGAAGVGKSRLILEFLETLGDVAEALRGRCLPYGERIPYWPLVEAVREAGGALDATSTDTVLHAFRELAHGRPLVLVLDDLQWADGALLDLVGELVATPSAVPLLVLCTARPELRDDYPAWGEGVAHASSVLLEPLTEAESERLVDNLLGDSELADPVRDHIVDSAEGNPLFLEELLATLVEREVLTRDAGRWTTTELPAIPLPPTIQALVAARLDRLPPDEREVLELASVDGTRFGRTAVSELAPRKLRGEVEDLLTALVRKEIVRGKGGEDLLSIRHQVIRDTAYGSMPIQRRAALHERMAQWLTSTSSEDERVRYHLELAERYRSELGGSSTTQV